MSILKRSQKFTVTNDLWDQAYYKKNAQIWARESGWEVELQLALHVSSDLACFWEFVAVSASGWWKTVSGTLTVTLLPQRRLSSWSLLTIKLKVVSLAFYVSEKLVRNFLCCCCSLSTVESLNASRTVHCSAVTKGSIPVYCELVTFQGHFSYHDECEEFVFNEEGLYREIIKT